MEITAAYIISQILAFIAFLFNISAYQLKKKSQILGFTITGNVLNIIHYILLGAWSGMATKILAVTRDSYVVFKDKKSLKSIIPLIIFICAYIIMAIITYESPLSLLPLLAATLYTIGIYKGGAQRVRIAAASTCVLWLIYNISVYSIAGAIGDIFIITSNIVAYYHYAKIKKRKTKKS